MIDGDDAARRLAHAILADVELYQGDAALRGSAHLDEGRDLFRTRVVPSLHGIFDEELARKIGFVPPGSVHTPARVDTVDGPSVAPALLLALALFVMAALGAGAFLLAGR